MSAEFWFGASIGASVCHIVWLIVHRSNCERLNELCLAQQKRGNDWFDQYVSLARKLPSDFPGVEDE